MADDEFKSLGVMVTPVKQEGVSPFKVTFKVTSSTLAKRFVFDFGDGLTEEGDLIDGRAVVEHTYVFVKTGKYNGTTYLPIVTVMTEDGKYPTSTGKGAFYVMVSIS